MQVFTEAQTLENLSPFYRPLFKKIRQEKIYSEEPILYAADFTGNDNSGTIDWGFMIFTDRRYLKVFRRGDGVSGISYYRSGTNWDKIMGKRVADRRWMEPHKSYKESYLAKLELPDCWDFEYSTLKGVVKNSYSVSYNSQDIQLIELRLEFHNRHVDIYKTFKAGDGEFVYSLLNLAMQNRGKIPISTPSHFEGHNSEITHLIASLADLYTMGILTDSEFEQKKKALLERL